MFLDASVIVAAMTDEPEAAAIRAAMVEQERLATSAIAVFEASCRVARLLRVPIDAAHRRVMEFAELSGIELLPIEAAMSLEAHNCAARYHHLTNHAARLNMGDCFAYAAALTSGLKLAYKGNDFAHTDIDGIRFGA
jgi:ribonuclease VapC